MYDASKINNFLMAFYKKSKHLMALKMKDKNYFDETVFWTILNNEKIRNTGVFLWIKDPDPGPVFFRIRIRVSQKDRIQIRNTAYHML